MSDQYSYSGDKILQEFASLKENEMAKTVQLRNIEDMQNRMLAMLEKESDRNRLRDDKHNDHGLKLQELTGDVYSTKEKLDSHINNHSWWATFVIAAAAGIVSMIAHIRSFFKHG